MINLQPNELLCASEYILNFYFGSVNQKTILSLGGSSLEEFGKEALFLVAKESRLSMQEEKCNPENIEKFMLPLIVYDQKGHTGVVVEQKEGGFVVYECATQTKKHYTKKEMLRFCGCFLFFKETKHETLGKKEKDLAWFFKPLKASWKSYVEVAILSFFINIFALALPLFTMNVYNRIVPNFATDTLFVLGGGVLLVFVFELVFKTIRSSILDKTSKKLGIYYEEILLEQILGVKTKYDTLLSGTKANLFRELGGIKEFFATRTLVQILDLPFFFIAVGVIYIISPTMALIPFGAGIVLILFNLVMQFPLASLSHEQFQKAQSKNGYLVESISGRDAIKLVNAHTKRLFTWTRVVAFYEMLSEKIQHYQHLATNSSYTIIQSVTLVVVSVGVYEIHQKTLNVGGLIAVTILASRAMVPIVSVSNILLNYKKMKDALESINEFWHLPREVGQNTQVGIGKLKGSIEFKEVSYVYNGAKYPSLDTLNLTIRPGEKVGIIGQTGAGKSTLMRLIALLDTPTKGTLYLDGMATHTLHPTEVREHLGIMPQNPYIFAGTIADNIALSRAISHDEIANIIELTGLSELIKRSGVGDSLEVGENGSNLSSGQKHLVALARALINNPDILILDEPTTGLDIALERSVVEKLKPLVANKTLLLITHRFSALELVDRVLVMNNGKIVADGPRDTILAQLQGGRG